MSLSFFYISEVYNLRNQTKHLTEKKKNDHADDSTYKMLNKQGIDTQMLFNIDFD